MNAPLTMPSPRTPDPRSAPVFRWGILGPGGIARDFAAAVLAETNQVISSVGSRNLERADAFADEFGVSRRHGSYEELVTDDSIDIVYVATPHSEHLSNALLAIEAGKPVLIEKSLARNAAEARQIVDAARAKGVYVQEAMWTRFLPGIDIVRQCLEAGLLGEVQTVLADHGQPLYPDGAARLRDPALAGGALLDLGIYPISFAHFVLGGITELSATGALTPEGVDAWEAMVVRGANGGHGVLHTTMTARTPNLASVNGTAAILELGDDADPRRRWYAPSRIRMINRATTETVEWQPDSRPHGLHFQAVEAARCIDAGLLETPLLPLSESVAIMEWLDEVRSQLGMRFPGE